MKVNNKSQPEKISYQVCRAVWDWIIQIVLWIAMSMVILFNFIQSKDIMLQLSVGFLCLLSLIYIINAIFISKTFKFLLNQKTSNTLHKSLEGVVSERPEISFNIECYHFESSNPHESQNSPILDQREVKTTTFADKKIFNYYSSRDVSGPLVLNPDDEENDYQYYYINLIIKTDLILNDALTIYDYNKQKEDFLSQHRWRDVHIDFVENKTLSSNITQKIVKIQEETPSFVKWQFYILSMAVGFVELYKLYVRSFICNYTYTIRKIISTRYHLHDSKYNSHNPRLLIQTNEVPFENTISIIPEMKPENEPTQEELNEARHYETLLHSLDDLAMMNDDGQEFSVSSYHHNKLDLKSNNNGVYENIVPDN